MIKNIIYLCYNNKEMVKICHLITDNNKVLVPNIHNQRLSFKIFDNYSVPNFQKVIDKY